MNIHKEFYQNSEARIRYTESGSGKPMLFLHGGGIRAKTYKRFLKLLSLKYHVIAPDLPCFGNSSVPTKIWSLRDYARFFDGFIKHMEVSQNISEIAVIGHSWGAGVALNLAVINQNISHLIVVNPAGVKPKYSLLKFYYYFALKRLFFTLLKYRALCLTFCMMKDFLINVSKKIFKSYTILKIVKNCIYKDYKGFDQISAKTLILWGEKDELFFKDSAELLHKLISDSQLVFLEGNHDWCLINPEEFFHQTDNFIHT
jgi:pimeloyl-ACP methyl ester carboxylesterase